MMTCCITYKGGGMMARDKAIVRLNEVSYYHLREKADTRIIVRGTLYNCQRPNSRNSAQQ